MKDEIFNISSILHLQTSNFKSMLPITKDIQIEDLIVQLPQSVSYLREKGIVCVVCGEPVWGSLNDLATQKELSDDSVELIIRELNEMLLKK